MPQVSILELAARIDSVTSPDIEARINTSLDATPSGLVLDFTLVAFASSMGLRVLLMAAKRCRQQNARLALHSVQPQIVDLFELSGLKPFFPMYDTRSEALQAVAG